MSDIVVICIAGEVSSSHFMHHFVDFMSELHKEGLKPGVNVLHGVPYPKDFENLKQAVLQLDSTANMLYLYHALPIGCEWKDKDATFFVSEIDGKKFYYGLYLSNFALKAIDHATAFAPVSSYGEIFENVKKALHEVEINFNDENADLIL